MFAMSITSDIEMLLSGCTIFTIGDNVFGLGEVADPEAK